jgi:ribonucleoside-diphosphate reductase subunit M2
MKDSPVKKLDFNLEDKENMPATVEPTIASEPELLKKPVTEIAISEPPRPKTIKELEAEEPILKENPHRFVLFPLQYHEIVSSPHRCRVTNGRV